MIYVENHVASILTSLHFRESEGRSSLSGVPIEILKPGVKQKPAVETQGELADYKFEEKEDSARAVRRRCARHHQKIRQK